MVIGPPQAQGGGATATAPEPMRDGTSLVSAMGGTSLVSARGGASLVSARDGASLVSARPEAHYVTGLGDRYLGVPREGEG